METSQVDGSMYPLRINLFRKINSVYTDLPTKHGQGPGVVKFQKDNGLQYLNMKRPLTFK